MLAARGRRSDVNWSGPARLFETRRALGLFPRGRRPCEVRNPFSDKIRISLLLSTSAALLVPGGQAHIAGAPKVLSAVRGEAAWLVEVGVACEPEAFLQAAASFPHPSESEVSLPVDLEHTVAEVANLSCADLARHRCQFLHSVVQRAQELAPLERQLHAGLAPHARTVLKGKRLLLLEELLRSLGHEDTRLVPDIWSGFKLTDLLAGLRPWSLRSLHLLSLLPTCGVRGQL